MNLKNLSMVFLGAAIVAYTIVAQAVTIGLVPVGNPGNAGEQRGHGIDDTMYYGSVAYNYSIGKFEITAQQYCEFLNAVATTDTYGLYSLNMYFQPEGCKIRQIVGPGHYTYLVDANGDGIEDADWLNRPVNYVTWGDAARFCNWLQNGQPTGRRRSDDDRGWRLLSQRCNQPIGTDGGDAEGRCEMGYTHRGRVVQGSLF